MEVDTQVLPILPLERAVILPHMAVTLSMESSEAKEALAAARAEQGIVLVVPRINGKYARVGTIAKIEDTGRLPNGSEVVVIRGLTRGIIGAGVPGVGSALRVQVEAVSDDNASARAFELSREYKAIVENLLEQGGASDAARFLRGMSDPGQIADTAGYSPILSPEQKVEVLETIDVEQRLDKVIAWGREALAESSLKDKIRTDVTSGLDKAQREHLLRMQMDAIRKELGEGDDDIVGEYRKKIDEAGMPDAVRAEAERELERLERSTPQNPEHGWIRTYLDWMVELPWSRRSDDTFDIAEARRILDADHTGLGDVKDRIIEFLAVKKLRSDRGIATASGRGSGAIITLVGPPGVGKTSLGESVARAMGRKFARVSLGGIHDEAEIRGHRRTYVGALPGRIARALKEAGTNNPVIMLDEIDKVGADWRGDPSSALLEVLDPAQNHSFRDHYLEVDLDLSDVLFIPTANVWDTIPGPLLDRMEIVTLDGYTEDEKVLIGRNHLLGRQIERNGLHEGEVEVTDDALRHIIGDHTREAGVRNLERELGKVLRKAATQIAAGELTPPVVVDADAVRKFLGKPKFHFEAAERTEVPGVATGLAVTGAGGDVLFIEATSMESGASHAGLTLTGQLGDVMKESAQIALSYVRSHAAELGIDPKAFENRTFHLHVPAGAVPKDGPSAGVTMTTALVSLLTGRPVRSVVGMTGEVTLQGRVLPIGGLKQKVLAAHRAGLKEVVFPARNEVDLDELPESVKEQMTFHPASEVAQVLAVALEAPKVAEQTPAQAA
ncbi:MAG: ATP-dependent Lon protease [Actinomycetota bacterium]|nr:ATP-dependent Lon protease [Actinomycetota bacterium]